MSDYATVADLKTALRITDTTDDLELSLAIQVASEMIDRSTGTRFWTPTTAETRRYTALTPRLVVIDDLPSTVSGAAPAVTVAIDNDADETIETTLSASDYTLLPRNAAVNGEPYTSIAVTVNGSYTFPMIEGGVSVTAKFGYSDAVPPEVKRACMIQAIRIFKRRDSPFGVSGTNNFGQLQVIPTIDPDVKLMLAPFKRLAMGALP